MKPNNSNEYLIYSDEDQYVQNNYNPFLKKSKIGLHGNFSECIVAMIGGILTSNPRLLKDSIKLLYEIEKIYNDKSKEYGVLNDEDIFYAFRDSEDLFRCAQLWIHKEYDTNKKHGPKDCRMAVTIKSNKSIDTEWIPLWKKINFIATDIDGSYIQPGELWRFVFNSHKIKPLTETYNPINNLFTRGVGPQTFIDIESMLRAHARDNKTTSNLPLHEEKQLEQINWNSEDKYLIKMIDLLIENGIIINASMDEVFKLFAIRKKSNIVNAKRICWDSKKNQLCCLIKLLIKYKKVPNNWEKWEKCFFINHKKTTMKLIPNQINQLQSATTTKDFNKHLDSKSSPKWFTTVNHIVTSAISP